MPVTILMMYLVAFGVALGLSWTRHLGNLRDTAANPMLLLAAYAFLVGGDYMSVAITGGGRLAMRDVPAGKAQLTWLAFQHAMGFTALCLGIYGGMVFANRSKVTRPKSPHAHAAKDGQPRQISFVLFYVLLLLLWFVLLRQSGGEDLSLENVARIKQSTIGDAPLFITSMLLLPAFTYALPNMRLNLAIAISFISFAILLYSGSRTRLLYVALPLFIAMVHVYRFRLPRYIFVIALIVASALAIALLNLRFSSAYGEGSSISTVSGTNIFDINDIAFAETSIMLDRISQDRLEAYIGEDFVGAIFASVPRSLVPFKPLSGSNQFTSIYDTVGWNRFGRGLLIGGINESNSDYTFPLSLPPIMLVGFAIGFALVKTSRVKTQQGFAGLVLLYVVLYLFLKADLQTAAQIIWSFVIYNVVMLLLFPLRLLRAPLKTRRRKRQLQRFIRRPASVPASVMQNSRLE